MRREPGEDGGDEEGVFVRDGRKHRERAAVATTLLRALSQVRGERGSDARDVREPRPKRRSRLDRTLDRNPLPDADQNARRVAWVVEKDRPEDFLPRVIGSIRVRDRPSV